MKLLATLLLISAGAAQADETLPIYGTWSGMIGSSPVNACFNGFQSHYFYLKHLQGILLNKVDGDAWSEMLKDPKTHDWVSPAQWKITGIDGARLTGEWSNSSYGRPLKIQLTRLSGLTAQGGCQADYYAPLAAATKTSYRDGKVASLALRIGESPLGNSFLLADGGAAARKINAFVASWAEGRIEQAHFCAANGGGGYENSLTASAVFGSYLLVYDDVPDVFCGGGSTNSAHSTLIFDLRTGERVEAASWLAEGREIPPPLRKLIMKQASACDKSQPSSITPALPSTKGLSFMLDYPRYHRDCNDTIEISYAQLKPYLSKDGKAFAQSVRLLSK